MTIIDPNRRRGKHQSVKCKKCETDWWLIKEGNPNFNNQVGEYTSKPCQECGGKVVLVSRIRFGR